MGYNTDVQTYLKDNFIYISTPSEDYVQYMDINNRVKVLNLYDEQFVEYIVGSLCEKFGIVLSERSAKALIRKIHFSYSIDTPLEIKSRTAQDAKGNIWIDFNISSTDVIKITPDGWSIVACNEETPFITRYNKERSLCMPERGGSLEPFKQFFRLSEEDCNTIEKFIVHNFTNQDGPFKPLIIIGEPKSGKTILSECLITLLDNRSYVQESFKSLSDLNQKISSYFMLNFDSENDICTQVGKALCPLTDSTYTIKSIKKPSSLETIGRPFILSSTEHNYDRKLDAKAYHINLKSIPKSQQCSSKDIEAFLDTNSSKIFGYFLDSISTAIKHKNPQ